MYGLGRSVVLAKHGSRGLRAEVANRAHEVEEHFRASRVDISHELRRVASLDRLFAAEADTNC